MRGQLYVLELVGVSLGLAAFIMLSWSPGGVLAQITIEEFPNTACIDTGILDCPGSGNCSATQTYYCDQGPRNHVHCEGPSVANCTQWVGIKCGRKHNCSDGTQIGTCTQTYTMCVSS